ncbi:MAG: hypothetical protein U0744_02510 [Gemmataceae bacterium]
MKLKIDPEFKALMPALSAEEYKRLDAALQLEGCRDAVVVWKDHGFILDGHNRHEICNRHRIKFRVEEISLPTRDMAIEWIVTNQLGRRNLTDKQRAYYIGKEYLVKKQQHGGDRKAEAPGSSAQNAHLKTAEEVAEKHGINQATVRRNAEFAEAVDKLPAKERAAVLDGTSDKTKAEIVAEAKPKPESKPSPAPAPSPTKPQKPPQEAKPEKPIKPGQVLFDKPKFDSAYGALLRQVDDVGRAYGAKDTPEADYLRKSLGTWKTEFSDWQKSLAKGKR